MSELFPPTPRHTGVLMRVGNAIAYACLTVSALALLGITGIIGCNVVARYFFNRPFGWAEELMLFLMVLSVFSGGIAVTWRNLHIRIDTFVERTPPRVQFVARIVAALSSIGILAVVTMASYRIVSLLYSFDQRSDALEVPSWIPQSFVTAGLGLMALVIFIKLLMSLFGYDDRPPPPLEDAR
jgi:TRAP-type C4-dicarboxylate transport system permease small subunit